MIHQCVLLIPPLFPKVLLSSRSAASTTESTTSSAVTSTEFKVSLGSSTNFRFLITSARWASLSVLSTVSSTCSSGCASWSVLGSHGPGSLGAGLSLECGWDNLGRQMQKFPQVLDALIGQVPVVMSPGKLFPHK